MRIISGKHKGKRIIAPKKLPVRPTTDMAKEGLFNILNNRIDFSEISVLDLFSGTGNISYEFASRGTKNSTAVDAHYACIKFIRQTANQLEVPITTIKSDVYTFLEKTGQQFDVIFADPPYDMPVEDFLKIVFLVFEKQILAKEGILILEHSNQTDLSATEKFVDMRKYGNSVFSFFQYK